MSGWPPRCRPSRTSARARARRRRRMRCAWCQRFLGAGVLARCFALSSSNMPALARHARRPQTLRRGAQGVLGGRKRPRAAAVPPPQQAEAGQAQLAPMRPAQLLPRARRLGQAAAAAGTSRARAAEGGGARAALRAWPPASPGTARRVRVPRLHADWQTCYERLAWTPTRASACAPLTARGHARRGRGRPGRQPRRGGPRDRRRDRAASSAAQPAHAGAGSGVCIQVPGHGL